MTRQQIYNLICLSIYLAALASAFYTGYQTAAAKRDSEIAALRSDYANQLTAASEAARVREQALTLHGNTLSTLLLAEQQANAASADTLKKDIDHVTSQYRAAPGAELQPAPRCVFTHGFVRVYNRAIGASPSGLSETDAASGADAAANAAETVDAGVSQQDVLAHAIDYGQRCRNLESQLDRLIDYTEETAK